MRPRPRLLLRLSLAAVLVVALFTGIRMRRDFVDFEVYRTAGARILHAEPLYRADDGHYQFKYWPAFAYAMVPFAFIPNEAGKLIWFAGTVALLVVYLRRSVHDVPARRWSTRALLTLTVIVTAKFWVKELVNGQTNLMLAMLVLAAGHAVEQRRPAIAGLLVGLATFIKPYALLFLPWVAVTAGPVAIGAGVGTILTGLTLPALTYGWQGNLSQVVAWYAGVTETTAPNLLIAENISFATMWAKWLGPGSTASALAAATSLAALGVAGAVWMHRRGVDRPGRFELGLLLLLVPLISPQGWDYLLLMAAPLFACLLDRFSVQPRPWQALTLVGLFLTSFTVFDVVGRTAYVWLMSVSAVSVGALLLAISALQLRVRRLA